MTVGTGNFTYEVVPNWGTMPDGDRIRGTSTIAIDAEDRVYAFCRQGDAVRIFDRDGRYITSWGEGWFVNPHGIGLSPDGLVYCVDNKAHTVMSFTPEGKLVRIWGRRGKPSDTGYLPHLSNPQRTAGPFSYPTNVAFNAAGEMFVSDGYGNARVHKYSPEGDLILSWGEYGTGPGQFDTVHDVVVDRQGRVLVCDRGNARIQAFTDSGEFLFQTRVRKKPNAIASDPDGFIYALDDKYVHTYSAQGELLSTWGQRDINPQATDDEIITAVHGMAVDSSGNIYTGCDRHERYIRKHVRNH
jgi:sugar lactone lactonase YvrE